MELSVISGSPGGSPLSDSTSPSSLWTSSEFSPRTEEISIRASSNSSAMNEQGFLFETDKSWGKGQICFGFNILREFSREKESDKSWD